MMEGSSDIICDGSVDESMDWLNPDAPDAGNVEDGSELDRFENQDDVPGILESMGLTIDSEDEDDNDVRVRCLYSSTDLEKVCQKENIKISQSTNRFLLHSTVRMLGQARMQRVVKKLVEAGQLEWEDEGYEVQSILDYVKEEDGTEYYLIKWKDWSHAFNTWEPVENLGCPDLVAKFHRLNKLDLGPAQGKLQSVTARDVQDKDSATLQGLYQRLLEAKETMTPLRLLQLYSPPQHKKARIMKNSVAVAKRVKLRAKRKLLAGSTNKRSGAYRQLKAEANVALKRWEKELNAINTDPASIGVENDVDLEGPPDNFEYINSYKAGPGVHIAKDPIVGCECTSCFDEKKSCCGSNMGAEFAYYKHGKVRTPLGSPIYECNKCCKCGLDCPNRVVQHGRKYKVAIFRTHNSRGWGVKTLQKIKKGSFVMEYVGEVITNEEAERRGRIYDAEGRTYLFDLDYNEDEDPLTVDAGFCGNVSHFINHSLTLTVLSPEYSGKPKSISSYLLVPCRRSSPGHQQCDPNLCVYGVWINTLDSRMPHIAFFAKKDINRGEELTFDYLMTGDTTHQLPVNSDPETEVAATATSPFKRHSFHLSEEDEPVEGAVDPVKTEESGVNASDHSIATVAQTSTVNDGSKDDEVKIDAVAEPLLPALEEDEAVFTKPFSINQDTMKALRVNTVPPTNNENTFPSPPPSESEMGDTSFDEVVKPAKKEITSPSPAMKYRIMCQCGAKNCRKYLF